jgi:hypothetical protein
VTPTNRFSAADAALGYLYQVRMALLWALRKIKEGTDFFISLETLDDVTFESVGRPEDLLQTKHHQNHQAALTDASSDLWKSLRIWFEGTASHAIPPEATLHLLTTATAPPASAAAYLRQNERNVDAALEALIATAQSSRNEQNAIAYELFLKTPPNTRRVILNAIVVIDNAPTIGNLETQLQAEIFWAVKIGHQEVFLNYLEGWWCRRVITQLLQLRTGDRIHAGELESQMSDLREQFKQDALPISDDLLNHVLDDAALAGHASSCFVKQLELVKANSKRIAAAVRDYYRAFEQRSRWLRDDLLLIGDLTNYERRLREEWELVFEAMRDKLGAQTVEVAKVEAARSVLEWAERTSIPIKPAVTEPFVTRGSMHILADDLRIGWHPEFRERLAHILSP